MSFGVSRTSARTLFVASPALNQINKLGVVKKGQPPPASGIKGQAARTLRSCV